MEGPDHLDHLRADTLAFAAMIDPATVTAPVHGCPGWDLQTLAGHLGWVHRWATAAVRTGAPPDPATIQPPPQAAAELAAWLLAGGNTLADELAAVAPDAPTWHPFPAPMVTGVWRRRQAQETSVHRWDVQSAVGRPDPIDALLAADGVGEYFELMLPGRFERDGREPPGRPEWLLVEVIDAPGSWWVRSAGGRLEVEAAGGPPAATLRGRGADLLLALYARRSPSALSIEGDPTLVASWLALEGN